MTHPNLQTNGASLEDCHTNFFALTELSGIKWRKLVWSDSGGGGGGVNGAGDPLDDPVLRSYARCIAADILCVWRRVSTPYPSSNNIYDPPLSLYAAKELWIFWYGDEPDLADLVAPELLKADNEGSFENGLSYECRSLLFKALHNLIERCLLSREFVRLGKWFVQPYEGPRKSTTAENASAHLSLSFAFFVHGESSVFASIDVRQHPPVRKLNRLHLQQAQSSTSGLQVILAPFGLAGTLTGQTYKTLDSSTRLLDDWSQFYPVDRSNGDFNVVEVVIGGVKMRYPACYVLVTDMDDNVNSSVMNGSTNTNGNVNQTPSQQKGVPTTLQTPPPSPIQINSKVPQPGPFPVSVEHLNSMQKDPTAATVLPERVWQDCMHAGPGHHAELGSGNWDFVDLLKKTSCACSKCRKYIGSSGGLLVGKSSSQQAASGAQCGSAKLSSSSSSSAAGASLSALSSSAAANRSAGGKGGGGSGGGARTRVPFHRRSPQPPLDRLGPGSYTPNGGPPSYPRTQESMVIPSVGSPPSAAPSPLPNPHSQQPASVPPGDQAMPTLSPHPPTVEAESPAEAKSHTPEQPPKSMCSVVNSPHPQPENKENVQVNNVSPVPATLKRPVLNVKEYETALGEEEHSLDLLYDYTTMTAWLNHPVKRFKPEAKGHQRYAKNGDIYSMFSPKNGAVNGSEPSAEPELKTEIKKEPIDDLPPVLQSATHGLKRPGDPYEFDDDGTGANAGNANVDGFKRGQTPAKEDLKKAGNLFTNEGLQPSYKDLDQIFDNSDDTSSDETTQIQTPPGSNKSHHEDSKKFTNHTNCPTMGILRPEELSKMYPTPPSLEPNPIASPGSQLVLHPSDMLDMNQIRSLTVYPNVGSPQEENIEDWSYVFKPPMICKMVGSSKYTPLTNLPSQSLPPVTLPPNCVYKPSWMQHVVEKQQNTSSSSSSNSNNSSNNSNSGGGSNNGPNVVPTPQATPNAPSAHFPQSPAISGFRPPPPYELPSPATSTASSYMNKNINSVEPANTPCVQRTPEANSLLVNILLADTLLNIFRDHNFDSCTLCVCNAGQKVVGNLRGADAGVYLITERDTRHQQQQQQNHNQMYMSGDWMGMGGQFGGLLSPPPPDEDSIRCSCGFSAVVNRKLAHRSGLFYEDEMEITGMAEDPGERKKNSLVNYLQNNNTKFDASMDRDVLEVIPYNILEMIREQCVMIQNSANSLSRSARYTKKNMPPYSNTVNILEYTDGNEVTVIALDQSKHQDNMNMCKMEDVRPNSKTVAVHRWPFLRASGPQCNQDIVRVMKNLQPLLQKAIQKKGQTRLWEAPSAVKGPLTWRQFHRLAGRGTDDQCEPQPIPTVVVGHEKDWLSLSPYALQHWETLLLEPYSYSRDVAYIVVAPDNEAILPRVRTFFKELSTAYEMCRLGRHSPITKVLRDGILRVGKAAKAKLGNEPVEEWFTLLGEGETTDMLKLYAQVCKHHLAPHLQQVPMDKTLLDPPQEPPADKPAASPMPPPPSTPDSSNSVADKAPLTPKSETAAEGETTPNTTPIHTLSSNDAGHDDDEREAPSVVVYLVDPFSMGSDDPELQRLACIALLRCFQSVISAVPENIRNNISVQIISQESIVELGKCRERQRHVDHMRSLALSIFSQSRRHLVHTNNVKSLTGFGTAANADLFLKSKDEKNRAPYKLYTPPYVLGPLKAKAENAESFGQTNTEQASILYLSYCLSEDQSYLLAVATDEKGEIFETCAININIPNRSRRKKGLATARRIGLQKLMDFALGVISQSVRPWRLVVGRLGRIGHGELKGWSFLLSRKNLLNASKYLKEICAQCSLLYPNNVPCILSACLVSLEPDSNLRLMPDHFTPDERFSHISVNSQLNTPQDVTCTHILVFPTSATLQSSQTSFAIEQNSLDPSEELFGDIPEGIDETMNEKDLQDIFNCYDNDPGGGHSPSGSPRRDEFGNIDSPIGLTAGSQMSDFPCTNMMGQRGEPSEEIGTVLQQPLALGYLVSTAPTGKMPKWFWASCPHLEGVCPAFLKNALHLHSPNIQNSEDILPQQSTITSHALDSQFTTDVLRYVLEGYNALSWLALDNNTRDRLSCLPVHIQVLAQLYHTTATLL